MTKTDICRECDLHERINRANRQCVSGRGRVSSPWWIIGEAPGVEEAQSGVPFVGKAGELLDRCLEDVKKNTRHDYIKPYVNNTICCQPPKNRNPHVKEIKACLPNLLRKLVEHKPKVILVVGNVPMKALTEVTGIKRWRGSLLALKPELFDGLIDFNKRQLNSIIRQNKKLEKEGLSLLDTRHTEYKIEELEELKEQMGDYQPILIAALHPAGVLRNPSWIYYLRKDMEKALYYLGKGKQEIIKTDYRTLPDLESLEKMIDKAQGHICSFDFESEGLEPLIHKPLCISFSFKEGQAFVYGFPVKCWEDETYMAKIKKLLKWFFADDSIRFVAQNAKFDMGFLNVYFDIEDMDIYIDTMLAHHLIEPNAPEHSLDAMGIEYTDMGCYGLAVDKYKNRMADASKPLLYKYSAKDADCTRRVAMCLRKDFERKPILKKIHDETSMPLSKVLLNSELKGVKIDQTESDKLHAEYALEKTEVEKIIYSRCTEPDFNPNSPAQVGKFIHETNGIPVQKETPSGDPSVDEEALGMIIEYCDHHGKTMMKEFCEALARLRKTNKIISTYLVSPDGDKGMLSKLIKGRLHTRYHISGTANSRISSSNPNLQNVPFILRKIFVPDNKQRIFVEADFDRIEMWVAAFVTQDPTLLKAYAENSDLHSIAASEIYGKPIHEITKEERRNAKVANFGVTYGMEAPGLSKSVGISLEEAEEFMEKYFEKFPGVKDWLEKVRKKILKHEKLVTPFGRERHFPGIKLLDKRARGDLFRSGGNSEIQSPAGEIMNRAQVRLSKKVEPLDSYLTLPVHDSIVANSPRDKALEVAEIMKEVLEEPVPEFDGMVFPAEVKIGYCWDDDDRTLELIRASKTEKPLWKPRKVNGL